MGYLFIAAPFLQFLLFGLIPVGFSLYASFTNWSVLTRIKWVGLRNYSELFMDPNFWKALTNTLYYFIGVPIGMGLALLLAILMNKGRSTDHFFRVVYYLPAVSSVIAISILWQWILNTEYGILNWGLAFFGIKGPNWLGDPLYIKPALILMGIWCGLGPMIILFVAALKNIPNEYYEAARIDGAGPVSIFLRITLPLLGPVLFYFLVLGFISNMQAFGNIYILASGGGPSYSAASLVYYLWQKGMGNYQMGYASAVAWILAVITMIVTFVQFRFGNRWASPTD
jgi:multiple sugar transport system permease protein